jgi:TP901 family phage tail tape measure protein
MGNEAKFVVALEGRDDQLSALFSAFKRNLKSDVSEIERTTSNLKLFGTLEADLKKAAAALDDTRARLTKLRDLEREVQGAGESIGKDLAKGLQQAAQAAALAEKAFIKQSVAVDNLRTSLRVAGVDTNNLAAAERKLAESAREAAAAAVEQQNKTALGFRTMKDIAPEVNRINAAYIGLRDSGKLTFGELSTLHGKAQQQIANIKRDVGGIGAAFREVRGSVIGFAAALAGVFAASAKSAEDFRAFTTQIAAVGTIAGVSDARLAELGNEVRRLSRNMGVDAVASARALYDILGSGVSPDNAIAVLSQSTQAARAGMTDVTTAASVGVAILNGYQLQVTDLGHVFDVLFQTVKDGVVTFPELAKNIGSVIPIARAANVPLEELGAAFVVLTRQGIDAPEAAVAISRAIQDLASPAPEAAERMRALGIEFRGLVGTVEQFASKNLSLDQLQGLIPDVRATRAVLALSQNFTLLRESVDNAVNSAGSMQAAYERMAATPQAKVDRFNASIRDLSLSVGEFVTSSSGFVETLTKLANGFNGMGEKAKQTTLSIIALTVGLAGALAVFRVLAAPLNLLAGALASMRGTTLTVAGGLSAVTIAVTALQAGIAFLLGFKLGEIMFEWSSSVRLFGNILGLSAAAVVNLGQFAFGVLTAAITLNARALADATTRFNENRKIIAEQWTEAVGGGAEKTRQLTEQQRLLGEQLNRTAKIASDAATAVEGSVAKLLSALDAQAKTTDAALEKTQQRLTSLVATLAKGVQDTAQAAQTAIANLAASTSTQLAALSSVDVAKVRETVMIQKDAALARLAILTKFSADAVLAFEAEAASRRKIAEKSGEVLARVDQDLAQARRNILQTVVDAYRAHVDSLLALERGHLDNIRAIEEQRRGINQSTEEKIREIRRQSLDAYGQYSDKVREIDELISKSRQALAAGDNKLAEEYAQKAISAATSVSTAVKDGEREVVSASTAQSTAIGRIQQAQDLLNKSLGERAAAEKAGADAATAGLREALPLLTQYQKQLAEVTATAKEGIKTKITADVADVNKAVEDLAKQLADRKLTVDLVAALKDANGDLQKAKEQLAAGVPVQLVAITDKLTAAIKAVEAAKPELNISTTDALAKVAELRTKAEDLATLRPELRVQVNSNVEKVAADFKALDGQRVTSYQDIVVTRTEGKATGGFVGRAFRALRYRAPGETPQQYASGGHVFRRPNWSKVPGTGSGDTVPAALQAGSFVVKKSASAFYGDGLMRRLATGVRRFALGGDVQRLAGGGTVKKKEVDDWIATAFGGGRDPFGVGPPPNAPKDPTKGFKTGDSFQDNKPPISFDTRKVPEELITAMNVLGYAREMLNAVGANNPLLGSLGPQIIGGIKKVEADPSNMTEIKALLQAAETIGANPYMFDMWGKTTGAGNNHTPTWFVDWLAKRGYNIGVDAAGPGGTTAIKSSDFAQRFFGGLAGKSNNGTNPLVKRAFAAGGSTGTDTVSALLTPGEWVIRKPAVARYGAGLLHAINSMRLSRETLARMMAPAAPVARFAMGGEVGAGPGRAPAPRGVGDGGSTINFNIDATSGINEQFVRRKIVPALNRVENRSK